MTNWMFENVRAVEPGVGQREAPVAVRDGRMVEGISDADRAGAARGGARGGAGSPVRIDGRGGLLTPGLIDVHTHGIHKHLFEASPDGLRQGLACLPEHGTTAVCPTFYTVMNRESLPQLEALARVLGEPTPVAVPGFHLEGPFLAFPGAGAATEDGDVGLLEEILAAADQRVAAMSISPDTRNILPVIERLRERDIVPFITHTQADYEQTVAAMEAGARHATHFYDVFFPPEATDGGVRPVGAVEALLADARATVDFICDGVHVHPGAIRLAVHCKGYAGVTLITDANIGAGLPAGRHDTPWGFPVEVAPGRGARNADPNHPRYGGLAGSALTMDAGINNLRRWLDVPEPGIWAMGTANPARLLNLPGKGSLAAGCDADLVLWTTEPTDAETESIASSAGGIDPYRPVATWVAGRLVWTDRDDLKPHLADPTEESRS